MVRPVALKMAYAVDVNIYIKNPVFILSSCSMLSKTVSGSYIIQYFITKQIADLVPLQL